MFLRRLQNNKPLNVKTRNNILIFVFIVITFLSLIDNHKQRAKHSKNAQRSKTQEQSSKNADYKKYDSKTFKVVKVIDGDTIDINIRDGKYPTTRIRLLGIDTPEKKRPTQPPMYYSKEASDFTRKLTLGKKITIHLDTLSNTRGLYGRLLAYVETDNGLILNEELVKNGFAYSDSRFIHSQYEKYMDLQKQAISNKAGLWRDVKFNQLPHWLQKNHPDILSNLQR